MPIRQEMLENGEYGGVNYDIHILC